MKLVIFRKSNKSTDGKKYFTYFAKQEANLDGKSLSVKITQNFDKEVIKADVDYPILVDLQKEDYLIKNEKSQDGTKLYKTLIIFRATKGIEKADLKQESIEDFFN